ncbi:MAG: hypothetical protein ACK4VN_06770 [Bacteroidales bacterium]
MSKSIRMVILNITQWDINYSVPWHYYGKLILCTDPQVTFHNIKQFDVTKLGENIPVFRELSRKEAVKMDFMKGGYNYAEMWDHEEKTTFRFREKEDLVEAGIKMFRELNLDVPFISVLEGKKYHGTKTLNEDEVNHLVRYRVLVSDMLEYWFSDEADEFEKEWAEELMKKYGSFENILNSEGMRKWQAEYDRHDYFETDE